MLQNEKISESGTFRARNMVIEQNLPIEITYIVPGVNQTLLNNGVNQREETSFCQLHNGADGLFIIP